MQKNWHNCRQVGSGSPAFLVIEVAKFLGGGLLEMPCRGGRSFSDIAPRILISSDGSCAHTVPYSPAQFHMLGIE
jgi:hypothetical protein